MSDSILENDEAFHKDLDEIENKIQNCLYSILSLVHNGNEAKLYFEKNSNATYSNFEPFKFKKYFYYQNFFLNLSELFTYFYKNNEVQLLKQFESKETERLLLKKHRNTIAHIARYFEGEFDEETKTFTGDKNYKQFHELTNESDLSSFVSDFIKIVKFVRKVHHQTDIDLKESKVFENVDENSNVLEETFINNLLTIIKIFPEDTMDKEIYDSLVGPIQN